MKGEAGGGTAGPFCLILVKAQPSGEDCVQIPVWAWVVPSTLLCPLDKLPMRNCKAAAFPCFLAAAPCEAAASSETLPHAGEPTGTGDTAGSVHTDTYLVAKMGLP